MLEIEFMIHHAMSTEKQDSSGRDDKPATPVNPPSPSNPPGDSHAGHGSDSAMKQLRQWEQRRAVHSGGMGRQGPH